MGAEYRFLAHREAINPGDEMRLNDSWKRVPGHLVGTPYDAHVGLPMRRKEVMPMAGCKGGKKGGGKGK